MSKVKKTFFFVADTKAKYARAFVPGKSFQLDLNLAVRPGAYLKGSKVLHLGRLLVCLQILDLA